MCSVKTHKEWTMTDSKKPRRTRRRFSAEYKAEVVSLCKAGGRSIGQVAKDMGLTETAVRQWIKRAEIDAGEGPPGALTSVEREELARLRRDLKRVTMERDILKKATAFFAKESR